MKTIINKLRYTLLLGFFALAALGNMNAQTVPPYSNNFDSQAEWNWWETIDVEHDGNSSNGGGMWTHYDNHARYRYLTNAPADDWLITSPVYLEAGKTYSISFLATTSSGYDERLEVKLASSNSETALSNGTQIIPSTTFRASGGRTFSNDNITVSANGNYYFGIHAISEKDMNYLYIDNFVIDVQITEPTIQVSSNTVNLNSNPGGTATQTVIVTGLNLTGNITTTLSDANGVFSRTPTSLGSSGGELTISYSPTAVGTHTATITLTSAGAESVTITLNGSCELKKTICDGSATSSYLPIYGLYVDNYQVNQMIYPAEMLTDLVGAELTSMTFYANAAIDAKIASGTWNIKLGTTDQTQYNSTLNSNTRLAPTDVTDVVATTNYHLTTGSTELTIVFTTPFTYNGGNLLIDFQEIAHNSDFKGTTFYGIERSLAGFNSHSSDAALPSNGIYTGSYGGVRNFLPKVTFTFEQSTPITNGTVTPNAVDFGTVVVGETATQTVTVRNTGNQPFTPTINATNLPQGITVSPTTSGQLAPGGTLNLTVSFTPTADGEYSGSFTVTIPVPDDDDIVVTVNVTGSAYVVSSTLTSNMIEVPVYKSEAKAPNATYVFSQDEVEGDTDMSLSYGSDADIKVDVLVKDDEPITSYDLRHKVGSGNWASAATATQDASNPKSYVYNNDTFVIPSDASQMWLSMTDEGADASSTISYVPVTVANGVVTQGNTYGAPQVQATNDPISFIVSVGGSKSAGRPGGHWDQNGVDYCIYTPVVTIANINPAFDGENRVPYLIRAWLLKNDNVPFYSIVRVANENDPDNSHIEAGNVLTYPYPLGDLHLDSNMISGQYTIGHDWSGEGDDPWNNPWGDVEGFMENVFAAPSTMPTGEHMRIAVRIYYYKPGENVSGSQMLLAANRDGDAPGDGYGYGEGEGNGEGIPTAVAGIYTDRQVVDVKYVNPQGMQSDRPFDGVNIIVTRYNDGSVTTSKVVR